MPPLLPIRVQLQWLVDWLWITESDWSTIAKHKGKKGRALCSLLLKDHWVLPESSIGRRKPQRKDQETNTYVADQTARSKADDDPRKSAGFLNGARP